MKYDIITVGSAVMDVFLDTDVHEHGKEICYPIGAKIKVKNLKFSTGGGGTNTAVAFSKLGLKTGYVGKLGKDENAEVILKELKKNKIDFLGVVDKKWEEHTGYSVILDSKEHDRTILTYKGINDKLKFSELSKEIFNTKWLYLSSADGDFLKTQEEIVEKAVKKGIKIAYNTSLYQVKEDSLKLKRILKNVNIFVLNKEEAEALVGSEGNLLEKIRRLGPGIVCVTDGAKGSEVYDGEKVYQTKAHKVKVNEATGAGDAYASGFVFGMIKFRDVEKSARIGTLNAENVIQHKGAKVGLMTIKEIKKIS